MLSDNMFCVFLVRLDFLVNVWFQIVAQVSNEQLCFWNVFSISHVVLICPDQYHTNSWPRNSRQTRKQQSNTNQCFYQTKCNMYRKHFVFNTFNVLWSKHLFVYCFVSDLLSFVFLICPDQYHTNSWPVKSKRTTTNRKTQTHYFTSKP